MLYFIKKNRFEIVSLTFLSMFHFRLYCGSIGTSRPFCLFGITQLQTIIKTGTIQINRLCLFLIDSTLSSLPSQRFIGSRFLIYSIRFRQPYLEENDLSLFGAELFSANIMSLL